MVGDPLAVSAERERGGEPSCAASTDRGVLRLAKLPALNAGVEIADSGSIPRRIRRTIVLFSTFALESRAHSEAVADFPYARTRIVVSRSPVERIGGVLIESSALDPLRNRLRRPEKETLPRLSLAHAAALFVSPNASTCHRA